MLFVKDFVINGNTYAIKDQLKNLGCYWDKEANSYKCDKHTLESVEQLLKEFNETSEKIIRTAWDQACKKYDVAVASKQHPLYPKILEAFKEFKQSPQ